MSLAQRKQAELYRKLDSLEQEFQYWRDQSEKDKQLEKHHTQIRRVTLQLEGLQQATRTELAQLDSNGGGSVLSQARAIEQRILEVHRIWEFFRSKFVLRSVAWFNKYLVAADEFAWVCYSAAQQRFVGDEAQRERLRQPPLVFFNGGSSPYTLARQLAFQAEQVAGEEIITAAAQAVLQELPIPIIGVPWFQIQHLPDALVIGHEVGHDVAKDFGLTTRLTNLLDTKMALSPGGVPITRRPAWRAWLGETFADLYGGLATGPAFVGSLLDFLATDATQTATEQRKAPRWGLYPPDYLRILVNLCALELQDFKTESMELRAELVRVYGDKHAMTEFEPDIKPVVEALFDGPYPEFGGVKLTEVLSFSKADQLKADEDSTLLLNGNASTAYDMRTLFAAARLAYGTDIERYKTNKVHQTVLDKVAALRQDGVRGPVDIKKLTAAERAALDRHDLAAGAKLLDKLKSTPSPAGLQE